MCVCVCVCKSIVVVFCPKVDPELVSKTTFCLLDSLRTKVTAMYRVLQVGCQLQNANAELSGQL